MVTGDIIEFENIVANNARYDDYFLGRIAQYCLMLYFSKYLFCGHITAARTRGQNFNNEVGSAFDIIILVCFLESNEELLFIKINFGIKNNLFILIVKVFIKYSSQIVLYS